MKGARLLVVAARAFEAAVITTAVAAAAAVSAAAATLADDAALLADAEQRATSLVAVARASAPVVAAPSVQAPAEPTLATSAWTEAPEASASADVLEKRRARDAARKRQARSSSSPPLSASASQLRMPWDEPAASADIAPASADCPRTQVPPLSSDLKNRKKRERGADRIVGSTPITAECTTILEAAVSVAGVELAADFVWRKFAAHAEDKRWKLSELEARWRTWVEREIAYTLAQRGRARAARESEPPASTSRPSMTPGVRATRKMLDERDRWEREEFDVEAARQHARRALETLDATG